MALAYPIELRKRVVESYDRGEGSLSEVGSRFSVARLTVLRWVQRYRETGDVSPYRQGAPRPSSVDIAALEATMARFPDATTGELTVHYNRSVAKPNRVHRSSILRALQRLDYRFKKNSAGLPSSRVRTWRKSGRRS